MSMIMYKNKGLTLIELMVAVAVFAVLTTLAIPAMKDFSENNRRVADINSLVGALNFARSEAVKRSTPVSICRIKLTNTSTCDTTLTNGVWTQGWIVFVDPANTTPGVPQVDTGETIIRRNDPLQGWENSTVTFTELEGSLNAITFLPNGFSGTAATFARCGKRDTAAMTQQMARAVLMSTTGNVRLSEDTDNNNIHNGITGSDITCP